MAYDSGVRNCARVLVASLLVALAGCDGSAPASSQGSESQAATHPASAPASGPATSLASLTDQQLDYARRPITYFNDKCGRCHGNYGSYWLDGVIAGLGEPKLREEVELMASGPSQAPLEGLALEVQVAYHRSLADGRPFITLFAEESGLAGEVTPGSRVLLVVNGQEQEAQVSEHRWQSSLRNASSVRVLKNGASSELPLPQSGIADVVLHSHAATTE